MSRLVPLLFAATLLPGCLIYADGPSRDVEYAPEISFADASCYWDEGYRDYVWWFQADVYDTDGDLAFVTADVYDDYNGVWVDAFELYHESNGSWFSAWQGESTWLDCNYYNYTVEVHAEDSWGHLTTYAFEIW